MLANSSMSRPFFFDDDDLRITFHFKVPNDNHQKDLNVPPVMQDQLNISSTNLGLTQNGFYSLHNKMLAYYKNQQSNRPDLVLNLYYARLTPMVKEGSTSPHGFQLSKNGVTYEVTANGEGIIEDWIKALKNVCVLTNFHEEYKAIKMIGKGSFAKVYLVEAKGSGKNYAVKAFCKEGVVASNKNNAKPSMLNEIDIMRMLDHPNIIKLYEVFETEKSIYLVLELIQGKSLQEVLKKGGFKDNDSRGMNAISSILDALSYMQSKGIMHRDLKPDNILLDKGDKIKIVDFGLATIIDVPEYIFKKCGTPGYIAPEVFKYDPKVTATFYDGRCDVFSAGCIFYYMVFGRPFFDCSNASEILKANRKFTIDYEAINTIKHEIQHPHSQIPKQALDLLNQLVEFDQAKRIDALTSINHPYIAEITQQKNQGAYNFYENVGYSPSMHDRRGSVYEQTSPDRRNSVGANNIPAHRYGEKDSLYLDFGKTEFTGRVDTINNGSNNNSLLLQRNDSTGVNSPKGGSPSRLSKVNQPSNFQRASIYGPQHGENFRKAAIMNNMQYGNGEENKESGAIMKRLQEVKHERRHSDAGNTLQKRQEKYAGYQFDDDEDMQDICQEDPQIHINIAKIGMGMQNKFPSRIEGSPVRFATGSHSHRNHGKGV